MRACCCFKNSVIALLCDAEVGVFSPGVIRGRDAVGPARFGKWSKAARPGRSSARVSGFRSPEARLG